MKKYRLYHHYSIPLILSLLFCLAYPSSTLAQIPLLPEANTLPLAISDKYTTPVDTPLSVEAAAGVLANDSDADGDALVAILIASTNSGSLVFGPDGAFTYQPNLGYTGFDRFTYAATDGVGLSSITTVAIAVGLTGNIKPLAVQDTYITQAGVTLTADAAGGVLTNDIDFEGETLAAYIYKDPPPPQAILTYFNTDGSFEFVPQPGFVGATHFFYRADDGTTKSNNVQVTVYVIPTGNHTPLAVGDSYEVNTDGTLNVNVARGVLANDSDADADPVTAQLLGNPAYGTLAFNADGSFDYNPQAGYLGYDYFVYQAWDGYSPSAPALVIIAVGDVNNVAPVAVDDAYTVITGNTLTVAASAGVLANDTDEPGDTLTAVLVDDVVHGTLVLAPDGSFAYTSNTGYTGSDSFTYKANDGLADSNLATVTISVDPVPNTVPVAVDDAYSVITGNPLTVAAAEGVLDNDTDADSDPLTAALVDDVSNGTLALAADGSFTYTPTAGYTGSDTFTYRANDGAADSNLATVTITVNPIPNNAPVAVADAYSVQTDATLTVAAEAGVLDNDSDMDADPLTAVLVGDVTHGTLTLNADGSFVYTPTAGYTGSDSFTYQASDGKDLSEVVQVTIQITARVNVVPLAAADSYHAWAGMTLTVDAVEGVLANDSDPDGGTLTTKLVATTSHGTLNLHADGSFVYVPGAGFDFEDSFTYQAYDGLGTSTVVTVTIFVDAQNTYLPVVMKH